MRKPPVTFFYPYPRELNSIEDLDLGDYSFWSHEGKERRRAWLLQTYLHLRNRGYPVTIGDTLPEKGLLVLLPEAPIQAAFKAQFAWRHRHLIIVTVRADVVEYRSLLGDVDIVQNGRFADENRVFFVPHWPQPGLLPRDATRGTTIQNIVFKGGFGSLDATFRSDRWHEYLTRRGLSFHMATADTEGAIPRWHDYRTADLNLAVRPSYHDGELRCEKPASKLVNAWHAGVPSLLGAEYAFREIRTSPLDYVEVTSLGEAISAVDHLLDHPQLYARMVEHARDRAKEFTVQKITERWASLLFDKIPEVAEHRTIRWTRPLTGPSRSGVNFLLRPPASYEFRKMVGAEMRGAQRYLASLHTGDGETNSASQAVDPSSLTSR